MNFRSYIAAIVLKEAKKEGMSYEDVVEVKEIQVDPPQNVEIRVKMLYASVCGTDILTIEGFMAPTQFPKVNGHEGVGIIERVGPEVTNFKVGDMILAPTYGECQVCSSCKSNRTNLCQNYGANESALEPDGTSRFSYVDECGKKKLLYYKLGCSTWTEYMVVDSNYAANLNGSGLPAPHLSIMSCAFATGYGAVWLDAKVQEGDSVAIFGVGSVGLSAVIAAKELKAKQIIVIDRNQTKLNVAMELGATHYINSAELPDDVTVSEKGKAKTVITGEGIFEDNQIRLDFKEFLFGGNVVGNVTGRVIRAGMDRILGYNAKTKTCKYQVDIRGGTAAILKGLNEYLEKDDCIKLVIKLSHIHF
ncbi:Aliphatic (R)-hydroxynitrile lyase [Linum perenne]